MDQISRRDFIGQTTLAGSMGLAVLNQTGMDNKNVFIHHVYFWLKNPDDAGDRDKLVEGLKKLSAVKTIRFFHIGRPADTSRDVIDRSYAVSWLLFFDNAADQESYQKDPIHLNFVETCSSLWSRVVVYDTVGM